MTNPDPADTDDLHASALVALNSAYAEVVEQIRTNPDRRRAYEDATQLATMLRAHADNAADLRALMATMIFEQDKLSLTGLAAIAGVSKQRASQLVKTGRRVQTEREHTLPERVSFYRAATDGDDDGTDDHQD